jgi:hypothetical protein
MAAMRPPKPTSAELHLIKENDTLRTTIVCLRRDLTDKEGPRGQAEISYCWKRHQ